MKDNSPDKFDSNFTSRVDSWNRKMPLKTRNKNSDQLFADLDTKRDLPIKKAMSAYVLYGNQRRDEITKSHGAGLKVTDVVRIIAKEWSNMSKQQKLKYKEMAKQDKIRFETEFKQIVTLNQSQDSSLQEIDCFDFSKPSQASNLPEIPKRPLTPYMLFVRETRKRVVDTMPHVRSLNIMKEVGKIWKTITKKELDRFRKMADEDLRRYHHEHEEFIKKVNKIRQ